MIVPLMSNKENSIRWPKLWQAEFKMSDFGFTCTFNKSVLVFKSLNGLLCEPFKGYFQMTNHQQITRNNHNSLVLPKVKLESAGIGFYSQGAFIFNKLPLHICQMRLNVFFKRVLKQFLDETN